MDEAGLKQLAEVHGEAAVPATAAPMQRPEKMAARAPMQEIDGSQLLSQLLGGIAGGRGESPTVQAAVFSLQESVSFLMGELRFWKDRALQMEARALKAEAAQR
jgi:hypothetical protein